MSSVPVTLIFSDGATCTVPVEPGENIVAAAETAGFSLLSDCREGRCATCMGQLLSGSVELDDYDEGTLDEEDRAKGKILTCVARAQDACVVEFPYEFVEVSEPVGNRPIPVTAFDSRIAAMAANERVRETIPTELTYLFPSPPEIAAGQTFPAAAA